MLTIYRGKVNPLIATTKKYKVIYAKQVKECINFIIFNYYLNNPNPNVLTQENELALDYMISGSYYAAMRFELMELIINNNIKNLNDLIELKDELQQVHDILYNSKNAKLHTNILLAIGTPILCIMSFLNDYSDNNAAT